jgi:hypothetical protein
MKGRPGAGSVTWTQQVPEREAVKRPPIWQPTDLDKTWTPFPDMHAVEYRDPDSMEGKLLRHESTEVARSARQRASGGCGMRSNAGAVPTDVRAAPAVGAGAPASGWRAGQLNRSTDISSNKLSPSVGDGTWTLKTDAKKWAGRATAYGIAGGTGGLSRSMAPRLSCDRMPQLTSTRALDSSAYSLLGLRDGATQSLHFAHQLIDSFSSP